MEPITISLSTIYTVAQYIYDNVKRLQTNKSQSNLLLDRINNVVNAIKPISSKDNEQQKKYLPGLLALERNLTDFSTFIEELSKKSVTLQFVNSSEYSNKIKDFNTELTQNIGLLNLAVDVQMFSETLDAQALQKDLGDLKLLQSQILEEQHLQTNLLERMNDKLNNQDTSHEIRELKLAKEIQQDFYNRTALAVHAICQQQKQQASETEQAKQSELLMLIHKELSLAIKKPATHQKELMTIKYEQLLVISMLQELQQEIQILKQHEHHPATLPHYSHQKLHQSEVLLEQAMIAKKQNDFPRYYDLCLQAANLAHAIAKAHVGSCLLQGKGVAKNPAAALPWITQAAQAQVPRAMYNLARIYETGIGASQDMMLAKQWYEAAAKQTESDTVSCLAKLKCDELKEIIINELNQLEI